MPEPDRSESTAPSMSRLAVGALAWMAVALVARAPLVARAEGMLDHDQSVVGLMALDIAELRRAPLFFDGQRYMAAFEAYLAAVFVAAFGHSPTTVAMAPWIVFGGFVALQYLTWASWRGPRAGHLAALLSVVCGPLATVWGIIPRGGYVEVMAWTLAMLALYPIAARPGRPPLGPWSQFGFGFVFALGYLLNPLSLILYAALAIDWLFSRHGPELRSRRPRIGRWASGYAGPLRWFGLALLGICMVTFLVHVDPRQVDGETPYVFCGGMVRGRLGRGVCLLSVLALFGLAGWWSGLFRHLHATLATRPSAVVGILLALSPFVTQGLLVATGVREPVPSLPVWFAAPWKSGPNARTGLASLGLLWGSDPSAVASVMSGQGVDPPETRWPILGEVLRGASPLLVASVLALLALVAWSTREDWRRLAALEDGHPGSPERLGLLYLSVAVVLYLLQGTSPNGSSIRYLVPIWVVLPGLIAVGLLALPTRWAVGFVGVLTAGWIGVQFETWSDIDRPTPARALASELEREGVPAIVAQTPVAIVVANLTHGRVGAVEYRPFWPRLGRRYRDRFPAGGPVICVTDHRFPWDRDGVDAWSPDQDLERVLRQLSVSHPGKIRRLWSRDGFDVWSADLPLADIAPLESPRPGVSPDLLTFRLVDSCRVGP